MTSTSKSNIVSIVILGILFFIFGFVTWLNSTLIPYLKLACELSTFQANLVTFAFYISYFIMAIPSSWILKKTGLKNGMMIGLFIMALGAVQFIPAANSRDYVKFLIGLFTIGTGLTLLQTASNPYITIVGPIESAANRISIMGICNKVAGFLAPLIMGAIMLKNVDQLTEKIKFLHDADKAVMLNGLAERVITPYIIMSVVLAFLALLVKFSPLPEIEATEEIKAEDASHGKKESILQFPALILGVFALFLYVGVEVIAVDLITNYGVTEGSLLSVAKNFPSYTLAMMVVGYVIGLFTMPKLISQKSALVYSAIAGIVFTLLAISTSGFTSVLFIAALGLANSLIWPAIWPLAIKGLGKFTKTGSALLIMSIVGGATLPLMHGKLSAPNVVGPHQAYWMLVPCYLFILYYGLKGYKMSKW